MHYFQFPFREVAIFRSGTLTGGMLCIDYEEEAEDASDVEATYSLSDASSLEMPASQMASGTQTNDGLGAGLLPDNISGLVRLLGEELKCPIW